MKKHNGVISLWKFIFCLLILIMHVGESVKNQFVLFKYGSIGVEFFFLVSGYLMAKSALKENNKETIGEETFYYIWNKIKSFFPYIFITWVLALVLKTILGTITMKGYVLSIWDLSMFHFVGYKSPNVIAHTWYIILMLLAMALLYPQIKKYKNNYFYLIGPIAVLLISGYINHEFGNLKGPHVWTGMMYRSFPRAYFEICLGSLLYPIVEKIKSINFNKLGRFLLTIIYLGCFIIPIVAVNFISTDYDFVLLLFLTIGVTIAFSEKTLDINMLNNKFVLFLEKMSLTVYLVHVPIRNFIRDSIKQNRFNLNYNYQLLIILVSSLVLGWIMLIVVETLKKKQFFIPQIKNLFVESNCKLENK